MRQLSDFKEDIHKCSKCGLCQSVCPIYKITGNDCTVSRGQFIMLQGLIKGELKMTKILNRYLDICLKCGACSKFCPSGIDVVNIISAAKYEYFKNHPIEHLIAFVKKHIIFQFIPWFESLFKKNLKSQKYDKKVLYYGGCASKFRTDKAIVKILNKAEVEVVNPNFGCCGISLFAMGDLKGFQSSLNSYVNTLKRYGIKEVVTTCASCEKTLKNYSVWAEDSTTKAFLEEIKVKNIYEYIRENQINFKLKKEQKVTYHKPCNIDNWNDIEWLLKNTENLNYIEMRDYDKCCGVNGLDKLREYPILINLFKEKRKNIIGSGAKIVLSSCLGCDTALKLYSFGDYKVFDLIDFLERNL